MSNSVKCENLFARIHYCVEKCSNAECYNLIDVKSLIIGLSINLTDELIIIDACNPLSFGVNIYEIQHIYYITSLGMRSL
jgi:hypothetical protein